MFVQRNYHCSTVTSRTLSRKDVSSSCRMLLVFAEHPPQDRSAVRADELRSVGKRSRQCVLSADFAGCEFSLEHRLDHILDLLPFVPVRLDVAQHDLRQRLPHGLLRLAHHHGQDFLLERAALDLADRETPLSVHLSARQGVVHVLNREFILPVQRPDPDDQLRRARFLLVLAHPPPSFQFSLFLANTFNVSQYIHCSNVVPTCAELMARRHASHISRCPFSILRPQRQVIPHLPACDTDTAPARSPASSAPCRSPASPS